MKFLKWLWKHLFIIIIATVVTIFMGYLATRWIRYNDTYLYRYLFQGSNGKFAWIGFTAIIAIITLAINAWDNRRKFKADLISKSRIKWIEDVRNASAGLIKSVYGGSSQEITKYGILLRLYFANDGTNSTKLNKSKDNAILEEVTTKARVDHTNNKKIINILINKKSNVGKNSYLNTYISTVIPLISNSYKPSKPFKMIRIMENGTTNLEIVKTPEQMRGLYVSNLCEIIRIYLKIEWDRAKKGE
ncbi:hypothetical protein [Pediococcus pentosaceus]|uniref:Uncharacterized protein n=1 Tax=Pediococcus pentosaceus TaxID=1255 RepID=A0ABQ6XIY5_PEDPE|nr:hypothetical protein [Pediococcus pentosaceus]KAF0415014.1 hypothetical protein GBO79_01455 [Pediococcus pentosaceus]KAF0502695.1 hypothetical protein GBP22_04775 [Pediococcus pentosaceus]